MRIIWVLFLFILLIAGQAQVKIPVYDFDKLEARVDLESDTLYVINFWATWCLPCVKELPEFQKAHNLYKDRVFKMLLVSLDFKRNIENRVIPFIEDRNLTPEVVLLSDPNANEWINIVDPDWSGAIPATIIFKKDFRYFKEGSMSFEELDQIISNQL